jgi:hypothetical protein
VCPEPEALFINRDQPAHAIDDCAAGSDRFDRLRLDGSGPSFQARPLHDLKPSQSADQAR